MRWLTFSAGAYCPTEDTTGARRALLRRLADAALAPFGAAAAHDAAGEQPMARAEGTGAAALPGAAAAAARVAAAVMDAEPRALAARLDALWALLWAAASGGGALHASHMLLMWP